MFARSYVVTENSTQLCLAWLIKVFAVIEVVAAIKVVDGGDSGEAVSERKRAFGGGKIQPLRKL